MLIRDTGPWGARGSEGPEALIRLFGLALLALAMGARPAGAISSEAGTSTAQFLKIGAGARAAAMAEAQAALADDVYAVYYNPAGLAWTKRPMLGAMHTQHFQATRYEFGALSLPLGERESYPRHALGLSIANLGVPDLERRTEDTDLPAGLFDASDYSYGLSYAYAGSERLAFGVTAKVVRSKIDVVSGSAVAADLGVRYRMEWAWPVDLAFVERNVGSKLGLGDGASDPLPRGRVVGAAVEVLPGLRLALDLSKYRDTNVLFAVGGEYERRLIGRLSGAFRVGYNNQRSDIDGTKGVALGGGLSFPSFGFDFAWVPFGNLGNSFRYSLLVKF